MGLQDQPNGEHERFPPACSSALALVGSSSLFIGDVSIIDTCPDASGAPTGIPDIAERAIDFTHNCSPNLFTTAGLNRGACPYSGPAVRDYQVQVGPYRQWQEIAGSDLHGVYVLPGDLPATLQNSIPTLRAFNELGLVSDGEFSVSGRAEQAVYAEFVAAMQTGSSNFFYNGANDQGMIKMRSEAAAQGLDQTGAIWACSIACYTSAFLESPVSEGTYVWLPFLPYTERAENAELDTFLTTIGKDFPDAWSVGAWNSGRALEMAINQIVAEEGPNAITRAKVLETMRAMTDFDSNGWIGTADFSTKSITPCFMMMQVQDGEFVRTYPTAPGTMDCDPTNLQTWTGDAAAEYE